MRRRRCAVETKIVLSIQNVDLGHDKTLATLAQHLDDLGWESVEGQVTATLYTDEPDVVGATLDVVHCIEKYLPDATVVRIDEQLVAVSDIADRVGMSSEGVRLWTTGQRRKIGPRFPAPRGQVSQGRTSMKVWAWADVINWLRSQYKLDPEPGVLYPSDHEIAHLNASLCDRADEQDRWRPSGERGFARLIDMPASPRQMAENSSPAAYTGEQPTGIAGE
jgi:hypothetical protein